MRMFSSTSASAAEALKNENVNDTDDVSKPPSLQLTPQTSSVNVTTRTRPRRKKAVSTGVFFMQSEQTNWREVFTKGNPKLKSIIEGVTEQLAASDANLHAYIAQECASSQIAEPFSFMFTGTIMTAMVDALYGETGGPDDEKPRENQEKLLTFFEALVLNGSETVMVTALAKIIE